jgi:hypothetical protein
MKYIITERQFNLINEELDLSSPFLRRRINSIEKIIQDEISKIHESGGSEFTNIIEFMNIVINIVVDRLFMETGGGEELDEEELKEFIEENYGDYIISMFPHDLEDEDEDYEEDEEGDDEKDDDF